MSQNATAAKVKNASVASASIWVTGIARAAIWVMAAVLIATHFSAFGAWLDRLGEPSAPAVTCTTGSAR